MEVGADGTVTATSTGGMVTAMNSDAYTTRITPMAIDLAPVTAGFMAGAGTVQVAAGQSVDHGDIEFTCAAGGADCEVMVMMDANGGITATSDRWHGDGDERRCIQHADSGDKRSELDS